jgi:hypothetical protein
VSELRTEHTPFRIQSRDASHSIVTSAASVFRLVECTVMEEITYCELFVNVYRTLEDDACDLEACDSCNELPALCAGRSAVAVKHCCLHRWIPVGIQNGGLITGCPATERRNLR